MRIAMWSGPRNISTAMMRAWENRPDTAVIDEPLYAHYLRATGIAHPGAEDVIAHGETDWRKVIVRLAGPVPGGREVFYQKHMAHHLLPEIDRDWLRDVENCFLVREPREMLISLAKVFPNPTLRDTGLPQQAEIFEEVRARTGETPPILDARDVLEDPDGMLRALCARLGVEFMPQMLRWPPGQRDSDGVWAKYWYANVWRSTGFEPYRAKDEAVPDHVRDLCDECAAYYDVLHKDRLTT